MQVQRKKRVNFFSVLSFSYRRGIEREIEIFNSEQFYT